MWKPGDPAVNVGVYINPPLAFPCAQYGLQPNDQCPDPGIACEFFSLCLEYLNLTYKIVQVSDTLGSHTGNGNWSGLLGKVHDGSLDSIALFTAYTPQRLDYFSYTDPFYDVRYAFVVKFGDLVTPTDAAKILVDGYSGQVWLALLTTILLLFISWTCGKFVLSEGNCQNKILHFIKLFLETIWETGAYILLQERLETNRKCVSKGALFVLISALTVTMTNLYQNVIYNQIASSAKDTPFRTTGQLVRLIESGSLTMLSDSPQISYFDYVNNSDEEHYAQVRQALRKNPLLIASNFSQANQLLKKGGYVYVTSYYFALQLVTDNCDLTLVFLDISSFWGGFIFNKESKLRQKFTRAANALRDVLERMEIETALRYKQLCPAYSLKPVTLKNFSGIFILFIFFAVVGFLAFLIEKVAKWIARKTNRVTPLDKKATSIKTIT